MTRLRGIAWDHPRGHAPLAASVEEARRRFGVQVEWEKRSLKDFGDADLADLARDYDLVIMDHPHVGEAAASGCLYPFDGLCDEKQLQQLREQSAGPSFDSYRYYGQQWALPVDAAFQAACFRPDLVGPEALPASWETVPAFANALRERGLVMGMALCPTDCLCSFLTLCAQRGDPPREGNKWIGKDTTVAVLEQLRLLRDHVDPRSMEWNPIRLYDTMASEETVAYSPLAFGYINYCNPRFRGNPLVFAGIPGGGGAVLGGAGIAISRRCSDPEAAAGYCLWIGEADYQSTTWLSRGGQPGNGRAWDLAPDVVENRFFLRPTRKTMEDAYMRPRFPGWPAFQEGLGERVHAFIANGGDPGKVHVELQDAYLSLV